jgi:hypothetical protein
MDHCDRQVAAFGFDDHFRAVTHAGQHRSEVAGGFFEMWITWSAMARLYRYSPS